MKPLNYTNFWYNYFMAFIKKIPTCIFKKKKKVKQNGKFQKRKQNLL